jgi:hypothetical protein
MRDGLYQTTIKDYLQFYRYIGETVSNGDLLCRRCPNGEANLYVVKHKGYYGFFIIRLTGDSKGISIVNGGATKKLTGSTDMGWICENFDIVLSKYLQMLMPLRNEQEQVAKELKELGLDGTIHGCIVDIDFYHHIIINPTNGSMTFYFSKEFGVVEYLNNFEEVIKSLELNNSAVLSCDCEKIRAQYDERSKDKGYLLCKTSDNFWLETDNAEGIKEFEREEEIVSRKDGMYGVSRKVNALQRLFSGHVLRDFDLRLTETQQKPYRTYLYTDRLFSYEGVVYKIVEDTGREIILAKEIGKKRKTRKFVLSMLKDKIKNKDVRDTCWIAEN